MGGLVELLVVVDAEGGVGRSLARLHGGAEAAGLRGEEAGGDRGEDDLCGEVVDGGDVEAAVEAGDLGVVPSDGEEDGGGPEDGEVVTGVSVHPDVVGGEDGEAGEGLLESGVEVVAEAGAVGRVGAGDKGGDDRVVASFTGEDEVLVEGRLQRAGVGGSQDGPGALDLIAEGEARLDLVGGDKSVVLVEAQAEVSRPGAEGDGVLGVGSELLDVGMAVEGIERAAFGEVVGLEGGAVCAWNCRAVGVLASEAGDEGWIDDADLEVLVEEGLGVVEAGLDVVSAVCDGEVGVEAGIGQRSLLGERLLLQVGRAQVGEGVLAGVVVEGVAAEEVARVEDSGCADDVSVGGCEVDGLDLGTLIGRAYGKAVGADGDSGGVGGPLGGVLTVVGVGGLEPGAGVVEVEARGVGGGDLNVDAVEEIFLVAMVVDGVELRRVEEAAGVHDVGGDEVAQLGGAGGQIESDVGGAEGSVGGGDLSGGLALAQAGAGGGDDDQRGLAAVLGRRRAGDDFERLDGVHGDLVGEDLGLLIGDGLVVDGEGVGCVVAHAVEEAVGVGRDAGRGEGYERADG